MRILLTLLSFIFPLLNTQTAFDLKDAGFPQGNLHGRYYNGQFYVPCSSGYCERSYYGTSPKDDWAYIPTSDELAEALGGDLLILRTGGTWIVLTETATGGKIDTDGYSMAEALSKAWMKAK